MFKRLVSLTIIAAIISTLCSFGGFKSFAVERDGNFENYAQSVLNDILQLNGYENGDSYQLSDEFEVMDLDTNTIVENENQYFVISDDEVIGLYAVYEINNSYESNYFSFTSEEVNEALDSGTTVAIGYKNDILYIISEDDVLYSSIDVSDDTLFLSFDRSICSFEPISAEYLFTIQTPRTRASVVFNKQLSVGIVKNSISPKTGEGLCWAASGAMKINYTKGKSLTARDVYYAMYNKYSSEPVGNMTWYKRMYPYYGISATYYEDGVGTGTVSTAINNNKPVQISVKNSTSSHAVVISGITIYTDHSVYTICDPNKNSKVYQNVSYAAMSDPSQFYYGSYTDWYRTIY